MEIKISGRPGEGKTAIARYIKQVLTAAGFYIDHQHDDDDYSKLLKPEEHIAKLRKSDMMISITENQTYRQSLKEHNPNATHRLMPVLVDGGYTMLIRTCAVSCSDPALTMEEKTFNALAEKIEQQKNSEDSLALTLWVLCKQIEWSDSEKLKNNIAYKGALKHLEEYEIPGLNKNT